jgi:Na+-driven multidrug efflux pump
VSCLRIIAIGYTSYAWGMIVVQGFNGAGDTTTPTLINLVAFWLLQLPLAYFLAIRFSFGPRGAFFAIPIADVIFTLMALLLFRKGTWKRQKI